jgi:hypothetical protein
MIRLCPQRKTSLLSTRREKENVTYIHIYVQAFSNNISRKRGSAESWIRLNRYWFLEINGRNYSPTFGQNNSKKGGRVAVQDKLLGSELCLLVFESKTGEVFDFYFCCMVGN